MSRSSRFLPLLLLLFAASGCSALIYEIVWYQMLQLAIGSTAVSLGFLLATFMGGLCIGSIGLPRSWPAAIPARIPCASTPFLEVGIGVLGILVLFGIPLVDRIYIAGARARTSRHAAARLHLRRLPAAAHHPDGRVAARPSSAGSKHARAASPGGACSTAATPLGAVFGCLLAGFYLLRIYNMATATYVAVAHQPGRRRWSAICWPRAPPPAATPLASPQPPPSAAPLLPSRPPTGPSTSPSPSPAPRALGAEVVWTRLMGMLLGSTVYVFSIILAVFLIGLALGSGLGSLLLRSMRQRPARAWRWDGARCCCASPSRGPPT